MASGITDKLRQSYSRVVRPVQNKLQQAELARINYGREQNSGLVGRRLMANPVSYIGAGTTNEMYKAARQGLSSAKNLLPGGKPARVTDVYNVVNTAAMPFTSIPKIAIGGTIGLGMQGVSNKLSGRPFFDKMNYGEQFGKSAAKTPFYTGISWLNPLSQLRPQTTGPIIQRTAQNLFQGAAREGLEGMVEGLTRPLNPGENRGGAMMNDIVFGSLFGAGVEGAGQLGRGVKVIGDKLTIDPNKVIRVKGDSSPVWDEKVGRYRLNGTFYKQLEKTVDYLNEEVEKKIPVRRNGEIVGYITKRQRRWNDQSGFVKPDELIPGTKPQSTVGGAQPTKGDIKTSTGAKDMGDYFLKPTTNKGGKPTLEAEVYQNMAGVKGIAKGTVDAEGIKIPKYRDVISIDDIPKQDRAGITPLIQEDIPNIENTIRELSARGYAYNDPLQFGLGKDGLELMDFSNVSKHSPEEALERNLDYLKSFYRDFGLGGRADTLNRAWRLQKLLSLKNPIVPKELQAEVDAVKNFSGDIKPNNVYFSSNARPVNLPGKFGQTQTEIGKGKYVFTEEPLTPQQVSEWELQPIITQPNVAQVPKPQSTVGGVSANPQISRPQIRPDQSMAQPQANLKVEQPPVKLQPEAKISISDPAKSLGGSQSGSSSKIIIPKKDKYAFNINKERLGLDGAAKKKLEQTVEQMKPLLKKTKGKPLTDKEVIQGGRKAVMLDEVMGRQEAAQFSEQLQASRNYLKSASNEPGVTPQYLQQIEVVSSTAADAGRRLRAFAVGAEDVSIKEQVLQELKRLEVDSKEILEASKNVDWNDAKQVTEFYRKFNPAKLTDRLEEFRYANMLSSPNTHIVNTFSNLIQGSLIAPVEKTVTGQLDWARAKLTGTEQKYFARQGVDYAAGYIQSLPKAVKEFANVMMGKGGLHKPDIDFIPTSTSKVHQAYTTPLRMLEAADKFFMTLVRGGEMKSLKTAGIEGAEAMKKADQAAQYRMFRQAFDPSGKLGQNAVLRTWDRWNSSINSLRQLPGGKWLVPFLQTPTNILKQGVEYSPLGAATIKGSAEPMVQLSKTLIGTAVFTSAYAMAKAGLTTWDDPVNATERSEFYAAGLQPYSMKIGDKWVSYEKLGPLAYPMAMASAMKWAEDNNADANMLEKIGAGMAGTLQFFADQSYMRSIGDTIDALRGDEFKQSRALANIPSQLIPYRALQGWIARQLDPVYRKAGGDGVMEKTINSIKTQIPIVSKSLPAYETPFGEPSMRQFPTFNSISPLEVTKEQPEYMDYYNLKQEERQLKREAKEMEKRAEEGQSPIKVDAAEAQTIKLPNSKEQLATLYKDALKDQKSYQEKLDNVDYESKEIALGQMRQLSDAEIKLKSMEYQNRVDYANTIVARIKEEHPEKVFEIELDTYNKDGGSKVADRTKWIIKQLENSKDPNATVEKLYEGQVLTKSVIEELNEKYGFKLNKYNYGDGYRYTGGSGKKGKKAKKLISDAQILSAYKKAITAASKRPQSKKVASISNTTKPIKLKRSQVKMLY